MAEVRPTEDIRALASWGWNQGWATKLSDLNAEGEPGRVVAQHRNRWLVATDSGVVEARVTSSASSLHTPVVGDWVLVQTPPTASDPHSLAGVLPRRTSISRGAAGSETAVQILAANVDTVWIVHGLDVEPNQRRLERYIAFVWESGAEPRVVLTKGDLAIDLPSALTSVGRIAPGAPICVISRADPDSIATLASTIRPGETVAMIGPSGVGKSTLLNLLSNTARAATADVRSGDRKGRHTTTHREIFQLPGGGLLLDTPGLRELRLLSVDQGLKGAFPEIQALADRCRFRDCRHDSEPGCAVQEAVASGALDAERLGSYHKLQAEAAFEARKNDPIARAAAISDHKTALKTLKHHHKRRGGY